MYIQSVEVRFLRVKHTNINIITRGIQINLKIAVIGAGVAGSYLGNMLGKGDDEVTLFESNKEESHWPVCAWGASKHMLEHFSNKTVLDFGTGTGVLAILAEMSGADAVLAIDNDDWSIENAAENITKNNCEKIKLQKASDPASNIRFDVILANINKNVILDNLKMLQQELKNDGILLLSGLLEADKEDIRNTATELHFILKKELLLNG